MSKKGKRRKSTDKKGRKLRQNEHQRETGLYEYTYTTADKRRHHIYSWRLVETDPLPAGKRPCKALRTMESEIQIDLLTGVVPTDKTLNEVFDASIAAKWGRANDSTLEDYTYIYGLYVRDGLGNVSIQKITSLHIDHLDMVLVNTGLADSTVKRVNSILSRTFAYAVTRDIVIKNPFDRVEFSIKEAKEVLPLTEKEIRDMLEFMDDSDYLYWKPSVQFLLETGLRIGELCALTWKDVNWEEKEIHVRHNIRRTTGKGGRQIAQSGRTKSHAGMRIIPLTSVAEDVLKNIREEQKHNGTYNRICFQDCKGLIFLNQANSVIDRTNYAAVIRRLRKAYNRKEEKRAAEENREPHFLPDVTPHVFRHTFVTRLVMVEPSAMRVKELAGHANINVTMKVYAQVSRQAKRESMDRFAEAFGPRKAG